MSGVTSHETPCEPDPSPRRSSAQSPSRRSLLRLGAAGATAGAALGATAGHGGRRTRPGARRRGLPGSCAAPTARGGPGPGEPPASPSP